MHFGFNLVNFYVSFLDPDEKPVPSSTCAQVCPPILVLSPSADRIYYALEGHPSLHTVRSLENLILQTAEECIRLQETDAASANQRVYHPRLNKHKEDGVLREMILCGNHQTNLIEGSLVTTTEQNLISQFFSFTHFVQVSSHFPKLKHALRQHVHETAVISHTVGQAGVSSDNDFVTELLDMQVEVKRALHHIHAGQSKRTEVEGDSSGSLPTDAELKGYMKKVAIFKAMYNQDMTDNVVGHACCRVGPESEWCCNSDSESKDKLASAMIDVALASVPETPAPGKWTKLWNVLMCLDFVSKVSLNPFSLRLL